MPVYWMLLNREILLPLSYFALQWLVKGGIATFHRPTSTAREDASVERLARRKVERLIGKANGPSHTTTHRHSLPVAVTAGQDDLGQMISWVSNG